MFTRGCCEEKVGNCVDSAAAERLSKVKRSLRREKRVITEKRVGFFPTATPVIYNSIYIEKRGIAHIAKRSWDFPETPVKVVEKRQQIERPAGEYRCADQLAAEHRRATVVFFVSRARGKFRVANKGPVMKWSIMQPRRR